MPLRLGNIKYDVTDYSVGYLPLVLTEVQIPTQYFTFAFRRQVVANFNINITSSGIAVSGSVALELVDIGLVF